MPESTDLLIIGAGPFGLALAAHAKQCGIGHVIVGEPMGFWRSNMPSGMYLRSNTDWHFDVSGEHTIERYLHTVGLAPEQADPLSLDVYLAYCDWFCRQSEIQITSGIVQQLNRVEVLGQYEARLRDGRRIAARNVVVAAGVGYFAHVPSELVDVLPRRRLRHTRDYVDFSGAAGRRVLIIGGRQSAFEWAALLREHGAKAVYLSYRHDTPAFERSDWSWVDRIVEWIALEPEWYRRLTGAQREEVTQRLWSEGRRRLEPWLAQRIRSDVVRLFPRTRVTTASEADDRSMEVTLSDGTMVVVDEVIAATGYKVDIRRIPFVRDGNILPQLEIREGFPVLDERMQSSLAGLFFTSACATQDFGPFFGFTVAVRTSAELIGQALGRSQSLLTPAAAALA